MKTTVYDVPAWELIELTAEDLKNNLKIQQPAFTTVIKTGAHRERAPQNKDWYYIRLASILRKIYMNGPLGTENLRTYYGGKKNRGTKPNQFRKSSGKLVRTCLQELEKAGLIIKVKKQGRKITPKGVSYLNTKAIDLNKNFDQIMKRKEEQAKQRIERLRTKEKELTESRKVKEEFSKAKHSKKDDKQEKAQEKKKKKVSEK